MFQKKKRKFLKIPSNSISRGNEQKPGSNVKSCLSKRKKGRQTTTIYPLKRKKGTASRALSNAYTTAGQLLSLKNNLRDRSPDEEHDVPFRNNNRQV